jgi:hypothetical protein
MVVEILLILVGLFLTLKAYYPRKKWFLFSGYAKSNRKTKRYAATYFTFRFTLFL